MLEQLTEKVSFTSHIALHDFSVNISFASAIFIFTKCKINRYHCTHGTFSSTLLFNQVAWFVSNCHPRNQRMHYARELSKYIQVDIYGACGSLRCPRSQSQTCFDMLDEDYKFYLAFENSNCKDYITEKFFVNGLGYVQGDTLAYSFVRIINRGYFDVAVVRRKLSRPTECSIISPGGR